MTDPERFLDGDGLEHDLLASASGDAGSDAAYRRVQGAIGAALAVTSASAAAAAGTGAAVGAGKAKVVSSLALGKWLVIGATAGTAVTGTAYVAFSPGAPAHTVVATATAAREEVATATAAEHASRPSSAIVAVDQNAAAAGALDPSPRPSPPEYAAPASHERVRAPSPPVQEAPATTADVARSPAPAGSTLAEEVRVLDAARAALARGDGRTARAELARHRHQFPGGALQLEAAVLGVRALLETGERDAAEQEGARVLALHPGGPYAERVRQLLGWHAKP